MVEARITQKIVVLDYFSASLPQHRPCDGTLVAQFAREFALALRLQNGDFFHCLTLAPAVWPLLGLKNLFRL